MRCGCWFLVACLFLAQVETDAAVRPNVVVILVDDMGYSDIGCYGSEIPTPHLDQLAENGLRFTQFYNTGRCCPTRASLLTGQYSHQAGVGHMTDDKGPEHPGFRGFLNRQSLTLAEVLGPAGYMTAASGKWHVGHKEQSMWPLQRGFDRFYGVPEGGGFYFKVKQGRTVVRGNEVLYSAEQQPPSDWYSTDAWTLAGLEFIDEALSAKQPFLLYLAHNAPHFPLQAPEADIAKFRGKYRAGWDALRAARHERQIELGLVDRQWPLAPRPDMVPEWDSLSAEEQDYFDHLMAIYAAVVSRMDGAIGTLVDGLKQRDVLDNTLILFMSDNGGTAESGPRGKYEGDHPGDGDSNVFYGQCWATLSNTPFRRYKRQNHEGGIATPLIAHWPAGIQEKNGLRTQPCHITDIMATLVDVTGADYPTELGGQQIHPLAGTSLRPAFENRDLPERAIFWEHEGNAAIRSGDWKLVRLGRKGKWELYNLAHDRTELNDLAAMHPRRVKELREQWRAWAIRSHAIDE
ncbi:MAG: arylsulfatase [Planctomycetaceae bacterium]|nr:arylsulfatase [Planctomycetaceae bacterium]